jgi:hypothetical protein
MGLAERRALNEFQEKHFNAWEKKIHAAAGFALPVEVKWPELTKNEYAHLYHEAWEKVYFQPLIEAFKEIGKDEMGRKALQAGVKKVVFCYSGTGYSNLKFEDGVIIFDHDPIANLEYGFERTKELVGLLEKAL